MPGPAKTRQEIAKTDKKPLTTNEATHGTRDANNQNANEGASPESAANEPLAQSIALLTRELQDFKKDMKHEFEELKGEVKKTMKEDLKQFKEEILLELQSHKDDVTEAQTRIADLETAYLEMKDTVVNLVKENSRIREKMVDLESRSRRNNMRIYGVPEGKEGKSVPDFVSQLIKTHINLPEGVQLQIQRAHRALNPKPPATAAPRSIVVAFLQSRVKELVLQQAWRQKVQFEGKRIFFDNDYASEIMEKRKAYAPIKATLKTKNIRFQTPFTKIRVFWENETRVYNTADEAAHDLIKRGVMTTWTERPERHVATDANLKELMQWTRATKDTGQRARERLEEFRWQEHQESTQNSM